MLAYPTFAFGVTEKRAPRMIGWVSLARRESGRSPLAVFRAKLKELGYVEGRDYVLEARWAEGDAARLPLLARELVDARPAVIVTAFTSATAALQRATSRIPVVFTAVRDPDRQGFVRNLARPGGNLTGLSYPMAIDLKFARMLRETLPAARRIAVLWPDGDPAPDRFDRLSVPNFEHAGFEVYVVPLRQARDIGRAFADISRNKADAVFLPPAPIFHANPRALVELAKRARLPLIGPHRNFSESGALMSYDDDVEEQYGRAALYVDRILKGEMPAGIPVAPLERIELTVNTRTATALGIAFPQSVLRQASRVID